MSSCIFCKIIAKEITGRIVYEDEQWLAFDDINPQAPVHVLIVPKEHIPTLNDLKESHMGLIGNMGVVINKIAEIKNVKDPGFRVVVNCNPAGTACLSPACASAGRKTDGMAAGVRKPAGQECPAYRR